MCPFEFADTISCWRSAPLRVSAVVQTRVGDVSLAVKDSCFTDMKAHAVGTCISSSRDRKHAKLKSCELSNIVDVQDLILEEVLCKVSISL